MSSLSVLYERPANKGSRKRTEKQHEQLKISWKGNTKIGMITTLLMAGTGVYWA